MAITVDSIRTPVAQAKVFEADDRLAAKVSPRDQLAMQAPAATPDVARDVTVGGTPPPEVLAMQAQLVTTAGVDVAPASRRDLTNTDAGSIQIGVRARVHTDGILNVGNAAQTSTGGGR